MNTTNFSCNLAEETTAFDHFFEHTVGSGHATLALQADWQKQIRRCHEELGFKYVRFHGIISDDMGTLVDEMDQLVYSFFNADQIFDFLLSTGMKPFVELSLCRWHCLPVIVLYFIIKEMLLHHVTTMHGEHS